MSVKPNTNVAESYQENDKNKNIVLRQTPFISNIIKLTRRRLMINEPQDGLNDTKNMILQIEGETTKDV